MAMQEVLGKDMQEMLGKVMQEVEKDMQVQNMENLDHLLAPVDSMDLVMALVAIV